MPDKPDPGPEQTHAPADPGKGGTAPEDLKVLLDRERQERIRAQQERDQIRTAFNRRDEEVRRLRQLALSNQGGTEDFGAEEPRPTQSSVDSAALLKRVEAIQQNLDFYRFRQDFPDAADPEVWAAVSGLVNDPAKVVDVAAYVPGTESHDLYRTLRNALREIQYQRLNASRSASNEKRRAVEEERETSKRQAAISGGGSYESPTDPAALDLTGKSSAEILQIAAKAGLLGDLIDPSDPPLALRKK